MRQKSNLTAIQYGEFIPKHEHHSIKISSFSEETSATFEANLTTEEAFQAKAFIAELQNPTEAKNSTAGKSNYPKVQTEEYMFPDRCYLLATDICTCGDHNPVVLRVLNNKIYFLGIPNQICGNEVSEKNQQIMEEVFSEVRVATEDEIMIELMFAATNRTSQAREFRDKLRLAEQTVSNFKMPLLKSS